MSQKKFVSRANVNLPFPYPMVSNDGKKTWPFKEEGFVLIYATLSQADKFVVVKEDAAIFALLKMGFFGFNSNKEMNHFYLIESLNHEERNKAQKTAPQFTLGFYSLQSTDIPLACTKYDRDANNEQGQSPFKTGDRPALTSLKLCLEEAYFLSYVFGLLAIAKEDGTYYGLKELWSSFCHLHDPNDCVQFAVKYAAYHYFRSKGWVVRNGFKFGTDYLLYKEGPPFHHANYSVVVTGRLSDQPHKKFQWNEISCLTRVSRNARKQLVVCVVSVPSALVQDLSASPECIQHFTIDLVHINRWNSKGEFDPAKVFNLQ